jgi:hypothetical protein
MNLSQALKNKNRLAGEIVRLQGILQRENARRSDSVSTVNREETWDKILKISDELGTLKAKIAEANVKIYSKLERMAELKGRIAFLQSLPIRSGPELVYLGGEQRQTYNWDSFISREKVDEFITDLQLTINNIQDEVDSYNAQTII